jgi:hypothetical protein
MALTDYSIDTSGSPQDVQRKQKLADLLLQQGGDTSPAAGGRNGGWLTALNRGLAGALGGYQRGEANRAGEASQKAERDLLASYPGANPVAAASSMGATAAQGLSKSAAAPDTSGKIYSNDEPSPMDPPQGEDRRKMMATILGEAGNESQLGKNGVASVIRTRAVDGSYGGDTPSSVVTAKNQFEPWNTEEGRARMARALADPKQAAAADAAIASAYGEGGKAPNDPTDGMTHFYSPKGQSAMGRTPPKWAGGESVTIGGHVFNSPDDAQGKPVQVASASAFAPQDAVAAVNGAAAGQPQQMAQANPQADPQAAQRQALQSWAQRAMLSNNAQTRQLAVQTLESMSKPDALINAGGGKLYNQKTGQWISAPQTEGDKNEVKVLGRDGELYKLDDKGNPVILHKNAAAEGVATVDEKTTDLLANRILQGDTKALVGLGRGAQGAANILAVQKRAAEIAADKGIDAKGIINNSAQNAGLVSSARALGTKETHFGVAEKAMEESIPIAREASAALPRTEWKTVTKLIQMGQTEHNNPLLKKFLIATDTAAKDYARTINPTGALREGDIEYARKILSVADSDKAYNAGLDQLNVEAQVMHRAIQRQKSELQGKPSEIKAAPQAAPTNSPEIGEIKKGHKYMGGDPANPASWSKVDAL